MTTKGIKLALCLMLWGCGESKVTPQPEPHQSAKPTKAPDKPAAEPAAPAPDKPEAKPPAPPPKLVVKLERKTARATLAYVLPKEWSVEKAGTFHVFFQPTKAGDAKYLRVGCQVGIGQAPCVGACTQERIAEIVEKSWAKWRQGWETPLKGLKGKTPADDVSATFKEKSTDKKGALECRQAHVTYAEEAKKQRPVKDRFLTRCTLHNPKDTLYVEAICRGSLKDEKALAAGFTSLAASLELTQLPDAEAPKKVPTEAPAPTTEAPSPKR